MADVTQNGANVRFSTRVQSRKGLTSGEAIATIGMPVYIKASDGKVYKCDVNASAEAALCVGVAMHAPAAADQPLDVAYFDPDYTPGFTLTKGIIYVPSATAGGIAPVADVVSGWYLSTLLIPTSTTKAILSVINSQVAT